MRLLDKSPAIAKTKTASRGGPARNIETWKERGQVILSAQHAGTYCFVAVKTGVMRTTRHTKRSAKALDPLQGTQGSDNTKAVGPYIMYSNSNNASNN